MRKYITKKLSFKILFTIMLLSLFILFINHISIKNFNTTISKEININEVPYISTYYITPVVAPNEDVSIDFYITDYNHTEYVTEDYSERFTVTIEIDGRKDIVKKNLKAGDHSINIGKFKELGEQQFSIMVTDEYGRSSHELFNFFLVKEETPPKEYVMTKEDLIAYNIKNTDSYETKYVKTLNIENPTAELVSAELQKVAKGIVPDPNTYTCIIADTVGNGEPGMWWGQTIVKYSSDYNKEAVLEESRNTRVGLQKLLDDKKAEGYTSLKLLPGTYRIDHEGTIYIPTEFTLDMNGTTFKLNQFTGNKALMVELNNTFDSHVINGTIEGDYYNHDYANSLNNSEWVMGISIGGESKYSSFENLVVKDITGYGGGNGIANSPDGSLGYTYSTPIAIGNTFSLGDIDTKTGLGIESTNRTTSDFVDISSYSDIEYLTISRYLGYQGNSCDTWNLVAHFYDENKNFIESINGYQYRRIKVPENASYMKVTILNEDYPTDLSVQLFRVPTHCAFKNVKFENCRAVGLAQAAMKDMLVENCEFTRSGQTSAKCAYDAEDGWDMMQDVTFKGLNFYNNPNNDFLTCAGHNFVIENMKNGKVHFWERTNSYVVKDSSNITSAYLGHGNRTRSGYVRFYNNEIKSSIKIDATEEDTWPAVVKDCKISESAENQLDTGLYLRCTIGSSLTSENTHVTAMGTGNFKDSYIYNKTGENQGGFYENCTIENISGNIHGTLEIINSEVTNFNCYAGSYEPTYTFKDSTLNNVQIQFGYWHQGATTLFDNCTINNDDYLLKLPHYAMKKPITLLNNKITSNSTEGLINFYDDRTGGSAGELIPQEYLTLEHNNIILPNSNYVITGLTQTTVNNINIDLIDNTISKETLRVVNSEIKDNPNIKITTK